MEKVTYSIGETADLIAYVYPGNKILIPVVVEEVLQENTYLVRYQTALYNAAETRAVLSENVMQKQYAVQHPTPADTPTVLDQGGGSHENL